LNNWFRLFLSTRGTITRRTFWHGVIVTTFVNATLVTAASVGEFWLWKQTHGGKPISNPAWVFAIWFLPLLTIWPSNAIVVKRLRTVNASTRLGLLVRCAWVLGTAALASAVIMVPLGLNPLLGLAVLTLALVGVVGILAGFLGDAVLLVWLGVFSKDRVADEPAH
jgi:uncharacterized membrane protein YhaH (DUF805 family)